MSTQITESQWQKLKTKYEPVIIEVFEIDDEKTIEWHGTVIPLRTFQVTELIKPDKEPIYLFSGDDSILVHLDKST